LRGTTYEICLRETILVPNTSTSLQTTLAAEAYPADGRLSLKEQTWKEDSLIYPTGDRRPAVSKREGHTLDSRYTWIRNST
jgi:hypothetical protein